MLSAVQLDLGYSSPAGTWHCPSPLIYPQLRPVQSLERSEHHGAICSGLGPEQLAFLQERKGEVQLCWVNKGLFLCSHVNRSGLGSKLERQSARWAMTGWTARQASALLWARGMLSLGRLALCPAQAFSLLPIFLVPPRPPALSVCPVVCLKEGTGCQFHHG